ncbi:MULTISPECIES: arsenic resistance N-acetyltransferase ArsN2 [Pseudomonas]|uniref:Acetyltransferase, GNAT family n=1 Tax=Pseudomonas fluorescens (strain Q2-87) TaxID=1038922 RepID=J2Y4Y9_PSEFQ|nr:MULTISPECIES: arsenic resistance N-acetyltransferase ArsN2 [Pseudomonas]EJL01874.1 acetyltransferase, GNAT family [Pseudomonas fluorescens Q2-87]
MSIAQHLKVSPLGNLDSLMESLRAEGLPYADLHEPERHFFAFHQDDQPVGYVGVEGSTADRLLRSFLIFPSHRGGGLGSEALKSVEALLVGHGVKSLHLLTNTAAPFFERHGFEHRDRAAAPSAIQGTLEFRSLCPATASYMTKRIA